MTNNTEKQWVVINNNMVIATFGREKGSMAAARKEAIKNKGWGYVAKLVSQSYIDSH